MCVSPSPVIYSVEGNIGSGKSTFVHMMKDYFKDSTKNIIFLQEPVDIWNSITDLKGESILTKFYANQEKYSFAFQMMAYISRLSLLKQTVESNPDAIIITERCLYTDKNVFAKMLYDSDLIEEVEYAIYLKWFDEFQKDYPINGYIYLKTKPETAYERVKKRDRTGESSIPLDYLARCHYYHDNWLKNISKNSIITLDSENDVSVMKDEIIRVENFIEGKN